MKLGGEAVGARQQECRLRRILAVSHRSLLPAWSAGNIPLHLSGPAATVPTTKAGQWGSFLALARCAQARSARSYRERPLSDLSPPRTLAISFLGPEVQSTSSARSPRCCSGTPSATSPMPAPAVGCYPLGAGLDIVGMTSPPTSTATSAWSWPTQRRIAEIAPPEPATVPPAADQPAVAAGAPDEPIASVERPKEFGWGQAAPQSTHREIQW